jgi:S-adenosylmethionine decarboxylase
MRRKVKTLGRHILAEFYNCDNEILNDTKKIEKIMNEATDKSGATIVKSVFHSFNPWGVSGVVVIAESHLTIHTWPEYGYAAVDVFTCGDSVNPWKGFEHLQKELRAEVVDTKEVPRGIVRKIKEYSHKDLKEVNYKIFEYDEKKQKVIAEGA